MPEISRFLGILITMYYDEHGLPHFHAKYNDYRLTMEINSGIISGKFPRRAMKNLIEWYEIHKEELLLNWELARNGKPLNAIEPLE